MPTALNSVLHAQSTTESLETPVSLARFLIQGIRSEREKLVRGVVEFNGVHEVFKTTNPGPLSGDAFGIYAFDFERDLVRYDNTEPAYMTVVTPDNRPRDTVDSAKAKAAIGDIPKQRVELQLRSIRNADYFATWDRVSPTVYSNVHIHSNDSSFSGFTAKRHHVFDIRALGILTFDDFLENMSLSDVCERLLKSDVTGVSSSDGLTKLEMMNGNWRLSLIVNEEEGFTPVEYTASSDDERLFSKASVEWVNQAEVWVPKRMKLLFQIPAQSFQRRYSLGYKWITINEQVEERRFKYSDFNGIPTGTPVIDTRDGRKRYVGNWKDGAVEPRPTLRETPVRVVNETNWNPLLIAGNVLALCLIAVIVFRRNRRNTKADSL